LELTVDWSCGGVELELAGVELELLAGVELELLAGVGWSWLELTVRCCQGRGRGKTKWQRQGTRQAQLQRREQEKEHKQDQQGREAAGKRGDERKTCWAARVGWTE
jgi:hypothetical protein